MGFSLDTIITPRDGVVYHDLAEGGVLLDPESGEYFSLNPTGRTIWGLLATSPTVSTVVTELAGLVEEPAEGIADDVSSFLDELAAQGLVTASG